MALGGSIKRILEKRFGGKIRFNEPMAVHTSFRIGGPADAVIFPESPQDIMDLMQVLAGENIGWVVVGGGTNLLVHDGGIRGVVISCGPGLSGMEGSMEPNDGMVRSVEITVRSGTLLGRVCRIAADKALPALVFAAGIPGTVGGAVMMNAGIPGADMSGVLKSLRMVCSPGKTRHVGRGELAFEYRRLVLPPDAAGKTGEPGVVVSVTLALGRPGTGKNSERIRREVEAQLEKRRKTQPVGFSAGSVFKNPPGAYSAGELIDRAGLRGYATGGAMVSEKHANFIVNRDNASAGDVLALIRIVRKRVYEMSGIQLEPEVRIIGEETDE